MNRLCLTLASGLLLVSGIGAFAQEKPAKIPASKATMTPQELMMRKSQKPSYKKRERSMASKAAAPSPGQLLEMTKPEWVKIQKSGGRTVLYFNGLVSARCAISQVRYGFNGEEPRLVLPLQECNKRNPYEVDLSKQSVTADAGKVDVNSVTVRITAAAGDKTTTATYLACPGAPAGVPCAIFSR